jgi:hypothetical protein
MVMPPQLARANRRRPQHSAPRPIVEQTPHVNINDLCRWNVFPHDWDKSHLLEAPFKYPFVKSLLISRQFIEANHHSDYNQRIGLHWVRTGFGRPRPIFVCSQCSVVPAGYSSATDISPAAIATKRSTHRNKPTATAANASPPANYASSSAPSQTPTSPSRPNPNGHAAGLTNVFATKSKPSKPKPRHGLGRLSAYGFLRIM